MWKWREGVNLVMKWRGDERREVSGSTSLCVEYDNAIDSHGGISTLGAHHQWAWCARTRLYEQGSSSPLTNSFSDRPPVAYCRISHRPLTYLLHRAITVTINTTFRHDVDVRWVTTEERRITSDLWIVYFQENRNNRLPRTHKNTHAETGSSSIS